MAEALEEVPIVALDPRGEGIADNGMVVPGALPGEQARVRLSGKRAELLEILSASPGRADGCGILKEMSRVAGRADGTAVRGHVQGSHQRQRN